MTKTNSTAGRNMITIGTVTIDENNSSIIGHGSCVRGASLSELLPIPLCVLLNPPRGDAVRDVPATRSLEPAWFAGDRETE